MNTNEITNVNTVIHELADLLGGNISDWQPNSNSAGPSPTLTLPSSAIDPLHATLGTYGYFVNMTGKTYKKPKKEKNEIEPLIHSWFVAGSTDKTWFIVKFKNVDFPGFIK